MKNYKNILEDINKKCELIQKEISKYLENKYKLIISEFYNGNKQIINEFLCSEYNKELNDKLYVLIKTELYENGELKTNTKPSDRTIIFSGICNLNKYILLRFYDSEFNEDFNLEICKSIDKNFKIKLYTPYRKTYKYIMSECYIEFYI